MTSTEWGEWAAWFALGSHVQPFRVLEHTADVGFEARGRTRTEAFRNAGRALMSIIVDLETVRPRESVDLQATASGPADLLVNWLSEILYLQDTEGWLFCDFTIETLTNGSIRGAGLGEHYDRDRHQIKLLVKAITYHQLVLEKEKGNDWRAQVYVDI
jgi:SHS2 domain-containing protein